MLLKRLKALKTLYGMIKITANYCISEEHLEKCNPLSANPTKWTNTLKQLVGSRLQIF